MAQHYNPHIVTDGLKLLIDPKDEICNGGKSVMTDLSGNLNSGSLYSGVGLKFDGVDDWAPIADSSLWDFGTGNFSISCWVRLDTNPLTSDGLVGATEGGDGTNNGWTLHLQLDSSDISGRFYYLSGGSGLHLTTSPTFTADSKFHHVVAVRDGDSITVYADGVAGTATTGVASTSINSSTSNEGITLGSLYNPNHADVGADNNLLNGYLSDVRIYHGALSAAQVSQIYNKPNTVLPGNVSGSQLKGWWPLIEGSGTTALDNSSNSNNSTFNSAPIWISGSATIPQTATGFEYSSSLVSNPNDGWFELNSTSGSISNNPRRKQMIFSTISTDFNFASSSFAVESWINQSTILYAEMHIIGIEPAGDGPGWWLHTSGYGNGRLQFYWGGYSDGLIRQLQTSNGVIGNINQWYHTVASCDYSEGTVKLYVDGNFKVSLAINGGEMPNISDYLTIGANNHNNGNYRDYCFAGKISSVKAYNTALSDVEVLQNFNAQRGRFGV